LKIAGGIHADQDAAQTLESSSSTNRRVVAHVNDQAPFADLRKVPFDELIKTRSPCRNVDVADFAAVAASTLLRLVFTVEFAQVVFVIDRLD
jgi:hypothetical protein